MDLGGKSKILEKDFKTPIDKQSERMAYDFLIEHLERHHSNLKPVDHYESIVYSDK